MSKQDIVKQFPPERQLIIDAGHMGNRKHLFPVLLECDVTDARRIIQADKQGKEKGISFTAFIAYCLAQAVYEHKDVNSYRKGRNQMIVFEDVDLVITQEIKTKDGYFPGAVTILAAQNCTVAEIQRQQKASIDSVNPNEILTPQLKFFVKLPQFVRRIILWFVQRDPIRRKKLMGTVLLSSVGMQGDIRWFYTKPDYTLSVFLGGIAEKLQIINDEIAIREYLHVTLMFDHDVVDAAPLARFAQEFKRLVESSTGLPESLVPQFNSAVATARN